MKERAMVVLSGGQDSTVCLYWAKEHFGVENIEAITFNYGQRHNIEISCAKKIAAKNNIMHHILPINTFKTIGGNTLMNKDDLIDPEKFKNLPKTFVPGRNIIFLTYAAAVAWQRDIGHLVIGVAQTDYSGYPDCRNDTMEALEKTLNLGLESRFKIHAPLMNLSKKDTITLATKLNAIDIMADTHTCYEGVKPPCQICAACQLRAKGFMDAGVNDPLLLK
jgi:7-cyano-7-deazaguanine synthase|tara:strand:+ start:1561 stop:2223 length:663 start_codon:yes stop_codon:yes gene_type:complete